MNADEHRCFLAFAYGEANNKRFYLCLSVDKVVFLYAEKYAVLVGWNNWLDERFLSTVMLFET